MEMLLYLYQTDARYDLENHGRSLTLGNLSF